jgi:proton glutamate symport protein
MKKLELHHWIFIGMLVGLICGVILNLNQDSFTKETFDNVIWGINLFGKDLFIGSLKMIIAPLIFASIISGICSLPSMEELGSIGLKTFVYYFGTTALAVTIGLISVLVIQPGHKENSLKLREMRSQEIQTIKTEFKKENSTQDQAAFLPYLARKSGASASEQNNKKWNTLSSGAKRGAGDMFREDILLKILSNPISSLANTNSLGIIVFAIIIGLACLTLGKSAQALINFFLSLNVVMNKITMWIMSFSPLAIGCLITSMIATQGLPALKSLAWYCITVIVGIAIHIVCLLALVAIFGKMNPITFIQGIKNAWLIAFSTTSSAATLPVTMKSVEENLNVSPKVSNFSLPVGATCNMDGTALYEGVAVIFMIQIYGGLADVPIELTAAKTFIIFITAVLASVGAAAVPSAGLITMAIVAQAVGLPLYYIPILYAVDHLLDQFRTSTNVMGDAAGAVIVNELEKKNLT